MENELTKALDKKFMNAAKFSLEVEKLVLEEKVNYIDAIVLFCEKNSIEVDSVTKLISKPLKEKLKADAINLNFMKKTTPANRIRELKRVWQASQLAGRPRRKFFIFLSIYIENISIFCKIQI